MILQLQKSHPAPDICLVEFTGKLMMGNDSRQVEWTVAELLGAGRKENYIRTEQTGQHRQHGSRNHRDV